VLSHRVGLTHNAFDRDLEGNAEYYHSLTMKLANAPLKCAPGECYAYQNVAFSLIGDVVFATTGQFFEQRPCSASHLQAARHA
jgi:beta-lactamase class C